MRDRPHSVDSDFVSPLKRPQLGGRNNLGDARAHFVTIRFGY